MRYPVIESMPSWLFRTHNTLYGWKLIASNFLSNKQKQVRFPRSKRWRIKKKWLKNPKNFVSVPSDELFILREQKIIVGQPAVIEAFRRAVEKEGVLT